MSKYKYTITYCTECNATYGMPTILNSSNDCISVSKSYQKNSQLSRVFIFQNFPEPQILISRSIALLLLRMADVARQLLDLLVALPELAPEASNLPSYWVMHHCSTRPVLVTKLVGSGAGGAAVVPAADATAAAEEDNGPAYVNLLSSASSLSVLARSCS